MLSNAANVLKFTLAEVALLTLTMSFSLCIASSDAWILSIVEAKPVHGICADLSAASRITRDIVGQQVSIPTSGHISHTWYHRPRVGKRIAASTRSPDVCVSAILMCGVLAELRGHMQQCQPGD